MYLNYYQLSQRPFQITTDPRFLWLGEKHSEALATLKYGIIEDKGFLLLTGDVGTGKTALIKRLVQMIDVAALVATVPDPGLDPIDFFNYMAEEFKMNRKFTSKGDFLIEFKQLLLKAYSAQQKVLLIIDEAQRLNHDLLEQVRLLSNIELDNRKLINIFFVGQTEFNRMLLDVSNRAVRQRISVSYFIEPLTEPETLQYIQHRLKVAGAKAQIFTREAMQRVFAFSKGYPRLINIVCDHALLTGYSAGSKPIDVTIICECEKELSLPDFGPSRPATEPPGEAPQKPPAAARNELPVRSINWHLPAILVFLLLLAFAGIMIYQYRSDTTQRWGMEDLAPQTYKGMPTKPGQDAEPQTAPPEGQPPSLAAAKKPPAAELKAAAPQPKAANPFARGSVLIYFPFNSNEYPPEALELMDNIADYLLTHNKVAIRIKGYTDSFGTASYNVSVSQFRANSVKSYFVGRGIDADRITAVGLGPKDPIAPNDTPDGRERNRRVEIEPAGPLPSS
jgi:general secretion pathway protein A